MTALTTLGSAAPIGPTGAAIDFVEQGWTFFETKANDFTTRALNLVSQLQTLPAMQPVDFNITFPDIPGLTEFRAPERPTLPTIEYREVAPAGAPEIAIPAPDAFVNGPVFDVEAPPSIALPTQPGEFSVPAPGAAPEITELTLPPPPALELPALPEVLQVTIPPLPAVQFPTYQGRDPGDAPALPDLAGASFTEQPYTRELLGDIIPQVRGALAGNTLLAASVEEALFARARERTHRTSIKARQEVAEEFSSRGFTEPTGAMAARLEAQTYADQTAANEIGRDLALERYQQQVKDVQFAITQGIACEQVLIGQHAAIMDRALQGAKLMLDARVALHNAAVASYNASIERTKIEADVFRTRIEAVAAELEAYRTQVEGQRAIADVNKAAADAYDSRVRGMLGLVEIYKGNIDAVRAQAEIEKLKIERHQSEVQAYGEQARAYATRWDGFRSAVEAQQAGFRGYEIGVQAWNARMEGWSRGEQIKVSRHDASVRSAQLQIEVHRSRVQEVLARLQSEDSRIRALIAQSEQIARMYAADAQIETARVDTNTRVFDSAVAMHTSRTNLELQQAQVRIQDAARVLTAQVTALNGAAQALTQLGASAMSAVNFSAGVSGSGSESSSYGYSISKSKGWSWGGEVTDSSGPDF